MSVLVFVDEKMASGTSLNMIPGGFKGLKFLHKHRIIDNEKIILEEREKAIETYQRKNPRLGVPNLIISELWKDEDYVQKVVCGHKGRLSVDQIRKIRELHSLSMPFEKIAEIVNANSVDAYSGRT